MSTFSFHSSCFYLTNIWQGMYASIELFSVWDVYFKSVTPNCSSWHTSYRWFGLMLHLSFGSTWHHLSFMMQFVNMHCLILCDTKWKVWPKPCPLKLGQYPVRFYHANVTMYSLAFKLIFHIREPESSPMIFLKEAITGYKNPCGLPGKKPELIMSFTPRQRVFFSSAPITSLEETKTNHIYLLTRG